MCEILIMYSTLEYDIMLGIIEKSRVDKFRIGQHVIVFYTHANNAFASIMPDPLRCIRVDEKYVYSLPDQILFNPSILPFVKYGLIFFSLGVNVTLEAPTNVQRLYQKIFRFLTSNNKTEKVIIKEDMWIVDDQVYDIQTNGLIDLFGDQTVDKLLDKIAKYKLRADIIHLRITELTNNMNELKPKSTRFFVILCYN